MIYVLGFIVGVALGAAGLTLMDVDLGRFRAWAGLGVLGIGTGILQATLAAVL